MPSGFYGRVGIVDTITPAMEELADNLAEAAKKAVLAGAEVIAQKARQNANRSPGVAGHGTDGSHMADNIRVEEVDKPGYEANARIYVPPEIIPYAVHQEFGPTGNRFMSRAVDEGREEANEAMQASLEEDAASGFRTHVRFRRTS